jgi:cytosine/adenosine deaminase-related metal-dependent hydrolase
MPLDPIHTIRAAKRLHLKDAMFVSLSPPGVFEGHLRARDGRVSWIGPASAVERGEEVLECWRQVVIPGLPLAGLHPFAIVERALPGAPKAALRKWYESLSIENHQSIAMQLFVECAAHGVLLPILDLHGAARDCVEGVVAAAREVGIRALIGCDREVAVPACETVRLTRWSGRPEWLYSADASCDAFSALRRHGPREAPKILQATYRAAEDAFGAPLGAFVRGACFDLVFLDYEMPSRLHTENMFNYILHALGPSQVEAAAVAGQPLLRRHDITTVDRAAVARQVALLLESAPGGDAP